MDLQISVFLLFILFTAGTKTHYVCKLLGTNTDNWCLFLSLLLLKDTLFSAMGATVRRVLVRVLKRQQHVQLDPLGAWVLEQHPLLVSPKWFKVGDSAVIYWSCDRTKSCFSDGINHFNHKIIYKDFLNEFSLRLLKKMQIWKVLNVHNFLSTLKFNLSSLYHSYFLGDVPIKLMTKGCASECQIGSSNFGYERINVSCCNTDLCNAQDLSGIVLQWQCANPL